MPLNLNFRVEDRGGVMVVVTSGNTPNDPEAARVATGPEVDLWNVLLRRMATPTRESYIRVNEHDLAGILFERDQLRKQVTELQREKREWMSIKSLPPPRPVPVCNSCSKDARHQTVPVSEFFFCDEHVEGLRTPTEPIPKTKE